MLVSCGKENMTIKKGWEGRFYEDFEVGDIYCHPLGRTVTEADNIWFSLLTMNTKPMHFDAEYAKKSRFRKRLVNSGLTLAIVLGQSVTDLSQNVVANLGWDKITLPNPVFEGDTLHSESQVLTKRESKSMPQAGIVSAQTRGFNQSDEMVIEYERTFMVYKRSHYPFARERRMREQEASTQSI
jgi:itaconyl-CoA hydratase